MHVEDLKVQDRYGVKILTYWFDYDAQTSFCLINSPTKEAAEAVHREAHGQVPSRMIEVDSSRVHEVLGRIDETPSGEVISESGLRAILFTDMAGSTELTQQVGDEKAMEILRVHDSIIREAVNKNGGRVIKHTGDGMMACFTSVVAAARASADIQRSLADAPAELPVQILVRVGLSAGEPVTENEDLFGAAVQLASRICGACEPGEILGSNVVRELSLGKGLQWKDKGSMMLRGFEAPVQLHELLWRS